MIAVAFVNVAYIIQRQVGDLSPGHSHPWLLKNSNSRSFEALSFEVISHSLGLEKSWRNVDKKRKIPCIDVQWMSNDRKYKEMYLVWDISWHSMNVHLSVVILTYCSNQCLELRWRQSSQFSYIEQLWFTSPDRFSRQFMNLGPDILPQYRQVKEYVYIMVRSTILTALILNSFIK